MGSGLICGGQELLNLRLNFKLQPFFGSLYSASDKARQNPNNHHLTNCFSLFLQSSTANDKTAKMDENVSQFMAITDQTADVARGCLEMTEGDVMAAVNMFFENPEIANSFNNPPPVAASASSTSAAAAHSRPQAASRSRPIGREDDAGVIHIDDDDDDVDDDFDDVPDDFDKDDEGHNDSSTNLQRIVQESDDAAMARRLQEEMYGGGGAGAGLTDSDGVRAPIARTTETLVAPGGYGYGAGDDDDVEAAMREMARRRARPASEFSASAPLLHWN